MQEAERPDTTRGVGPIRDGTLQVFQPSGWREEGVDVPRAGQRGL